MVNHHPLSPFPFPEEHCCNEFELTMLAMIDHQKERAYENFSLLLVFEYVRTFDICS